LSAEKTGYEAAGKTLEASSKLLDATPSSLEQNLPLNADDVEDQISLINVSAIPLTVKSLVVSNDFEGLFNFYWKEDYTGLIASGGKKAIVLRTEFTDEGKKAYQPTVKNGVIRLTLESPELGKQWIQEIPLSVRIVLPGQVDKLECLLIEPSEWVIASDGSTIVQEFSLTNECLVDSKPVALRELQAKVDSTDLGEFILSSSIPDSQANVGLKTSFNSITASVPNGSNSISLTFKPKEAAKSGKKDLKVSFKALNASTAGDEVIKAGINAGININQLASCVKVKPQGTIQVYDQYSNLNSGYGATQGYLPSTPFSPYPNQGAWNNYSQGFNPNYYYGSTGGYSTPFASGNNYPNAGYGGYSSSWDYMQGFYGGYGQSKITITNSCSAGINAFLQATPGIYVSEQQSDIAPGQSAGMQVLSQGITGMNYKVDVTAKLAEGLGEEKLVASIPVQVLRDFYEDERDCFTVNPQTLNFSALVPDKELKVYNKCYPAIRLNESDIKIEQESMTLPKGVRIVPEGTAYFEQVYTYDDRDFKDGQKIQVIRVGLRKNPNVVRQAEPTADQAEWYGTLEAARNGISSLAWTISVNANLRISYKDRTGQKTSYAQKVDVKDAWNALEAKDLIDYLTEQQEGNPKFFAESRGLNCVKDSGMDIDAFYSQFIKGRSFDGFKRNEPPFIEQAYADKSAATYFTEFQLDLVKDRSKQACGNQMKIKNFYPAKYEDKEVSISITPKNNSLHSIVQVVIKQPIAGKTAEEKKVVSFPVQAEIESGWQGQKEKWFVNLTFKMTFKPDAIDFDSTATETIKKLVQENQ
ncbi:hypothetical protein HZB89_01095, partial [archaeon]|nr:hypothetical protein [archaeon]